jgi:hypothetical protein
MNPALALFRFPGLVVVVAIVAAGCGSATVSNDVSDAVEDTAVADSGADVEVQDPNLIAPGHCDRADIRLLRVNPWADGGLQIYVAGPGAGQADVSFADDQKNPFDAVTSAAPSSDGLTGIVVVPSADPTLHSARLAAAHALADALPDGERVAVWAAGTSGATVLLSDFAGDPAHAVARIDQIPQAAAGVGLDGIDAIRGLIAEADGRWGTVLKRVVVVADAPIGRDGEDPVPSVAVAWLVDANPSMAPDAWVVDSAAPAGAVSMIVESIAAERAGVHRIGVCPAALEDQEFEMRIGETTCTVASPKPAAHLATAMCIADAAATDAFDYGDTIEFVMTPGEKAVWNDFDSTRNKEDFTLSVRLGYGDPVPAIAHFRGQSSMGCARKSYDVNLDGGQSRRLMPGAGDDKFYLISLCMDDGYFNQIFANRVLGEWDAFPLKSRVVRLRVDGTNMGFYLMVQEPSDTVVKLHIGTEGVIRRPYEPDPREQYEVKYSASGDLAATLQYYLDMTDVARDTASATLVADLSARLDMTQYLRWMAFMTFMHNGDYIDEVYFYGTIENNGVPWWRVMNWDSDDLFSTCHHGGIAAKTDPWGMLYCAEGFIDDAIVGSPEIYAAWADELDAAMAGLTAERAKSVVDGIRDDLFALLDDETAAALVEFRAAHPEAVDAASSKVVIQGLMDEFLAQIEASRTALTEKMAAYRTGQLL